MIRHTKGIVLSSIKYAESSIVCRIYTEEFGIQSYLINGVRKKRGTSSYYQVLSILDLVVFHKDSGGLQRVKEVRFARQHNSIPFNILKSSVALFLAEVLNKCLREEEKNQDLFSFLLSSIIGFDKNPFDSSFHVRFLLKLSAHLGFYPDFSNSHLPYFDLMNGFFVNHKPAHQHFIGAPLITLFVSLLKQENNILSEKKRLLNKLLEYYELHLDGFANIRSHEILDTVLKT